MSSTNYCCSVSKMLICCRVQRMLLVRCLMVFINVELMTCIEVIGPPVTLTYNVVEEQPVGTELGNLLADTGLSSANRSVINQIYFSVLPGKYK